MASTIKHICWLHGWGMSPSVWGDVLTLLPEAQISFIDYSECAAVDDFRHVLQAKLTGKEGAVSLIGWSMGGMLALEEVFRGYEQIESIVLIGATLRFASEDRDQGWPIRMVERMSKQVSRNPDLTLQEFAKSMLGETEKSADSECVNDIQMTDWIGETDFTLAGLEAGLSYLRETDLRASWAEWRQQEDGTIRPRLLWIHGLEDPICPPGCVPQLESDERIMLERTGHAPMLTQRTLLKEHLRRFLHGNR